MEEAKDESTCLYVDRELLERKWRRVDAPAEESETYHQVALPRKYQQDVTRIAHEDVMAHLGASKTGDVILQYFLLARIEFSGEGVL